MKNLKRKRESIIRTCRKQAKVAINELTRDLETSLSLLLA